jgi:hypothetical protein
MTFLDNYDENSTSFITFLKNNIEITHNNGDKLKGSLQLNKLPCNSSSYQRE